MKSFVFAIVQFVLFSLSSPVQYPGHMSACLTGYMTQLQSWVDEIGTLIVKEDKRNAIDLSGVLNPAPVLSKTLKILAKNATAKYLSMARCQLNRVPVIFSMSDSQGRLLSDTVEYMSFYGNHFVDVSSSDEVYDVFINATDARGTVVSTGYQRQETNAVWSVALRDVYLPNIKELDLRASSIQVLSANIFMGMPQLESLYLGENKLVFIDSKTFLGLDNLLHLDISLNEAFDERGNMKIINTDAYDVFNGLRNLQSLDLSFTRITLAHMSVFRNFGSQLKRLSICGTGISSLPPDVFNQTSLQILDVSGNYGILAWDNVLRGLENSLRIIYAKDIGLRSINLFQNFTRLEVIDLSKNEIESISPRVAKSLVNVQILNLDKNRLTVWNNKTFIQMPELRLLSLRDNNINLITEHIINDLANVSYVALSRNFIVCNCHSRDFFDLAMANEHNATNSVLQSKMVSKDIKKRNIYFHTAFEEYNELIEHRQLIDIHEEDYIERNEDLNGSFVLLDYDPSTYMCVMVPESRSVEFSYVASCNAVPRDVNFLTSSNDGWNKLYLMFALPCVLVVLIIVFVFRRYFRYCCITMRNSAMLSLVHNTDVIDDDTIFHYDVFVSYCHEDRNWVLDHLIPHLESDCSISACLHERDFQVGHSILENIVSCMDRSRSIMLIISHRFLLSKWCQFEMHLAQHRLLETRREDLTLVLLEEIPRSMRPNTLHYLMLTKTYIVWPKDGAERELFWKRLKKSFMCLKMKSLTSEVTA